MAKRAKTLIKEKEKKEEIKSKLVDLLECDTTLDRDTKMSYVSMANLFLKKFDTYMNYTSLDMNKEIPLGIDTWKDFLNYPIIKKYIQSFRDEQIFKIADKGLMEGDKSAIGIKKIMEERGPIVNNSNIIIIRLPEKVDYND